MGDEGMANREEKIERLREVPFLSVCTTEQLAEIARMVDEVRVLPGYVLAVEGRPGHSFYVIVDGRASVTLGGRSIVSLGPGDFFGEMSILESQPRSATVTAETPMVLYEVHVAAFHEILRRAPEVSTEMLRTLSYRLRLAEGAPTYEDAKPGS